MSGYYQFGDKTMKRSTHHQKKIRSNDARSAFTLVEMLVSVTLVLMMMTLFASIFQMATGSMGKQRSISEHDQRARSLTTLIRKDFQHRTSRYPFAYFPGEDSATSRTSFANRSGYFYLSTNDPNSGLDDLVQFTVNANILSEDPDGSPFYGATVPLTDRRTDVAVPDRTSLAINANQPETDDGSINPNFAGSSPAAEVSYFVRKGNLYRRIVLIREPLAFAGQNLSPQPTARSGYDYFFGQPDTTDTATFDGLFQPTGSAITNDFYRLFDYSAFAFVRQPGGLQQTRLMGIASLGNETAGGAGDVLGFPTRRFGFNPFNGLSREHNVLPTAGFGVPRFLGRFTQAETSTLNFNWPQATCRNEPASATDVTVADSTQVLQVDMNQDGSLETTTNGNPFDVSGCPLSMNAGNGLVSGFDAAMSGEGRGGSRRMEDLLLANVHEMKIEIWDDRLQRYVTPGHNSFNTSTGEAGDYNVVRCLNPTYSPLPGTLQGTVLDTWHSGYRGFDLNANGSISQDEHSPPYLPYMFYPPRQNDNPPGPSPNAMTAGLVKTYWQAGSVGNYNPGALNNVMDGSIVFAPVRFDGDGSPEVFEWPGFPIVGTTADVTPEQAFHFGYVCIRTNDLDADGQIETGLTVPPLPLEPGREVLDNEVTWQCFDNRRPLKSIRLQIRFYDSPSQTMRQVSLVLPLTEVK